MLIVFWLWVFEMKDCWVINLGVDWRCDSGMDWGRIWVGLCLLSGSDEL